jgi:hypothetical protein
MRKLQRLSLAGTQITDIGLENLKSLKELSDLTLERTYVTNAGIAQLKKAKPNLQVLLFSPDIQ